MRLLIADSDPMILRSLKILFDSHNDIEVVGLIADSADAVDMCRAENPDVMLLDYRLDGVTTTRQIKYHCPNTQIIMLTVFDNTPEVRQAIKAGAKGYISKADNISSMMEKLRTMVRA